MKTHFNPLSRFLSIGTIALCCLTAFSGSAQAKGPKGNGHSHSKSAKKHYSQKSGDDSRDRQVYSSHPRSGFVLTPGNGYAGRGYYYGPPNSPYYYERPEVRYYATREAAPREYYGNNSYQVNSSDSDVQRALANLGYYQGSIDGQFGPQSRRAISRFQGDRGMRQTGYVTSELLRSLGL